MVAESSPARSKKKEQIVETAEALFNQHGFKRVSVEEICRKAKVSKMTFYRYFPNKIELVKHLWNRWVDEGYEKLDEIDAMDISLPEKIKRMFEWKTAFIEECNAEFLEEIMHLDLEHQKVIERFAAFLAKAQKRGEIRAGIHPHFIIAVLDKLYELANDDELRSKYSSLLEFNREAKDFFWYGIIARPGKGANS